MSIAARSIHGLGVCLIPSLDNQYKPLALRHRPLALVSALLVLTKIVALTVIAVTPATAELSTITTDRMIQLTNAERTKIGLSALKTNNKLMMAAQEKGADMLKNDYFAHISPAGITPWFWIKKVNYSYEVAGENLAIDFTQAEDVVAAWLASPSHKENLLRPDYTETGLAVVTGEFQGGTSTIVVHMFGKPSAAQVAAEITSSAPQATPSPSASPTVLPTVTPAPPTATPPPAPTVRVPRIALLNQPSAVASQVKLLISGQAGDTVHLLINNQLRQNFPLTADERQINLSLNNIDDGTVILRAYASDQDGNNSALSDPLAVAKDTAGPAIADKPAFVIGPLFDQEQAVLLPPAGDYTALTVIQGGRPLAEGRPGVLLAGFDDVIVSVQDEIGNQTDLGNISLKPTYQVATESISLLDKPARISSLSRRLTVSILVSVLGLLIMAIIVRIRIQHPALITHASFVILLAVALLLI